MSATANFAATPYIGSGNTTTADTSTTAPTNATVGVIATALGALGHRLDQLSTICLGTSVAGLHRLWLCEGTMGPVISSITSATTTATVTTATNHNLISGDLITLQGAFPVEYNVASVAVTVLTPTTFTYTIASTAGVAARDVGLYSSTHAAPVYHLLKEIPVQAVAGSTTGPAFQYQINSVQNPEILPLVIPPGWSVRSTVTVTQTNPLKTTAMGGKF
jgi:hypothetical protein